MSLTTKKLIENYFIHFEDILLEIKDMLKKIIENKEDEITSNDENYSEDEIEFYTSSSETTEETISDEDTQTSFSTEDSNDYENY